MGLEIVAAKIAQIGAAAKGAAKELREAAAAASEYAVAAGSTSEAGKYSRPSSPATSVGATSLGNPRDASDQAARMYAAIEAAKRR